LSEHKQQQVLALGRLGWSLRRIEDTMGVRRETASAYLKAAGIPVRRTGGRPKVWPPPPSRPPANPATTGEVSTDSGATSGVDAAVDAAAMPSAHAPVPPASDPPPGRARTASACEAYRELIVDAVRRAATRWRSGRISSMITASWAATRVCAASSPSCGASTVEAHAIITTAPDEEAQVDYGEGPMVRDPATDKYRRTRLFLLTLGYSRKSVRLLMWRSSTQIWAERHERAFRRLGGTVRVIVLDNLREGVIAPDNYDPTLNPLYRDLLAHYGVVALPCRVGHPDRKGKVEAGIGHTQKTPLKGLRFETLDAAQAYLDRWEERWADTRLHGTTKRQAAAMFAEERPALGPLPLAPFRYYRYGVRTVHLDGCVEVEAAYYSAPPGWIGRQLQVQWTDVVVRLLDPKTGQLMREHVRACASAAWLASHRGCRSAVAHPAEDGGAPRRGASRRPPDRCTLHAHPPARWRRGGPPHPRRALAREEARARRRRRGGPRGPRARGAELPLRAALPRATTGRPAHAPASRSAHPAAHAVPRLHRPSHRRAAAPTPHAIGDVS